MKTRENIESIIVDSFNKSLHERKEEHIFGTGGIGIVVYIIDPLPENVNLQRVLSLIEHRIPQHFVSAIDAIYIEHLEEFDKRSVNAVYKNGSIYVSNFQDSDMDLIDDIVHEIAHSVEDLFKRQLYMDDAIKKEFLGKRKRLLDLLKQEGYNEYEAAFSNANYSQAFDVYLYQTVGYSLLRALTQGLFLGPYSITSLREYFAAGFEEYFIGDRNYLRKISPQLYNKIEIMADL